MPKDRLDIMIDIETLGNDRSKGMAFSVAYAPFTLSAVEGEPWNAPVRGIRANQIYIEVNSSVEYGRRWDQTTIEWWKAQPSYNEVVK
ncbi:MAG: hypothetical protein KBT04_00475, partial [Bacteroidales bacterium]|nr:hypothetical protein [Candidatus Colimorpha onthohippi]